MVLNIILAILCLGLALYFFLWYNNGLGGSLKSKRPLFAISLALFIAFIFFTIKAYYYNDNKNREEIISELSKEFNEFEKNQLKKDLYQENQIQEIQNKLNLIRNQLERIETLHQDANLFINSARIQTKQIDSLLSSKTDTFSITIGDFNLKYHELINSLENEKNKEREAWFYIFISIICGFLFWLIGFIFKNRIFG